ncbi:MAG: DegT/DnrJ/EryC1/StrS family aminotransferase [Holophagales bacterium]|nr:DegT/DnrJ/EryC1/StrS family aminotransferase [Holophagales bacterium]
MTRVPFAYLDRQFADLDPYLEDLRELARSGQFTLGPAVSAYEERFAALQQAPHAVGVSSGTDALVVALEAMDIGPGDEVITCATTFVATVGAIVAVGARPVLVDCDEAYLIDCQAVADAVGPRTRAILPVHYTGDMADMKTLGELAEKHGLRLIEDACQAVAASIDGRPAGLWSDAAAFSLHPLKNLNVWGEGGVVVTRSAQLAERIRLRRNHGLIDRDRVAEFGRNYRLHALQAVIGLRLMDSAESIIDRRNAIAARYDEAFRDIAEIRLPPRRPEVRHAFHLYVVQVERRDQLLELLHGRGVEAKIHYPIPIHLQPAAAGLGYGRGDFPRSEHYADHAITLPGHQHLTDDEVAAVITAVREFYGHGAS